MSQKTSPMHIAGDSQATYPPPSGEAACYYSNGKLLLSGEYLVLAGATALAMPVRYGQRLCVSSTPAAEVLVNWTTYVRGRIWYRESFRGRSLDQAETAGNGKSATSRFLRSLLMEAKRQNPAFLQERLRHEVRADTGFEMHWGLGSSSSLISNIAWWASADPYQMLFNASGGSGYDIACARSASPLFYRFRGRNSKPETSAVAFDPPFGRQLVFVYSGRKQDSSRALENFDPDGVKPHHIQAISGISVQMARSSELEDFMGLMREHEGILSAYTGTESVQKRLFPAFPGAIKSLGAWGGDFLLAAAPLEPRQLAAYFSSRGYGPVFALGDLQTKQ